MCAWAAQSHGSVAPNNLDVRQAYTAKPTSRQTGLTEILLAGAAIIELGKHTWLIVSRGRFRAVVRRGRPAILRGWTAVWWPVGEGGHLARRAIERHACWGCVLLCLRRCVTAEFIMC